MPRNTLLTFFLLFTFSTVYCQTNAELSSVIKKNKIFRREYNKAENYLANYNYGNALKIFLELDSIYANNSNIKYKIGLCYTGSGKRYMSTKYYEAAKTNISKHYKDLYYETTAPIVLYSLLADSYLEGYKFSKAIEYYDLYMKEENLSTLESDSIKSLRQKAIDAPQILENPLSIKIQNLGQSINSQYDEYSPVITLDNSNLFFTSRRKGSTGNKICNNGLFYEDIYCSTKNADGEWNSASQIGGSINTAGHEATISISSDGKTLFLYKDDKGDGNIYTSQYENGLWEAPVKLPEPINTKSWETHACLSPDMNTIYFVSNRKGGAGGRDIWKSELKNGKWGKAENLGKNINTRYDEESPYMLPDGKTLYFSSKGHKNMGGFDIFITKLNDDGTWTEPENIGYPINTTGDDIFYIPTSDQKNAYYSSSKKNGFGGQDLYVLTIIKQKKKILYMRGLIVDSKTLEPIEANVSINCKYDSTFETSMKSNYEGLFALSIHDNDEYSINTKANGYDEKLQTLLVKDYEKKDTITIEILLDKQLIASDTTKPEIIIGDKITMKNIFYDFDKATLRQESKTELDKLVELMNNIPTLKIELASHTDSYGSDQYNILLSQKRANSVVKYLIDNGINSDRLVAKGYGETKPIASNSNAEGRQLNRRTEFTVLSK